MAGPNPDELLNHDPHGGAGAARLADESFEAAVRRGLAGVSTVNDALEHGKKHSWVLVVVLFSIAAFIVKSTLFYAEQAQFQESVKLNQVEGKAFRDATTAHLNQIDETQRKTDIANREFNANQQIAINRLTDIVDLLREKR